MMDAKDQALLALLKQDCKKTIRELSSYTHLSPTAVYERIKKLESSGVIEAYTIKINKKKTGQLLSAFCQISLDVHHKDIIEKFEKEIFCFDEVTACYHLAGIMDYLLHVTVTDMNAYQDFLKNKLATMENIRKVQSSFVMTEVKSND